VRLAERSERAEPTCRLHQGLFIINFRVKPTLRPNDYLNDKKRDYFITQAGFQRIRDRQKNDVQQNDSTQMGQVLQERS